MKQTELTAAIQSARAGDPQAQETLVLEVQDRVYYHCRKIMKNESDAQDAAQDVLIAVLTNLDKLKEPAAFYGWVNGITANRCKHLLTRGNREWQIPEDEDGGSMLDDLEDLDQQAVPEAVLDNKETKRLMLEIIDALPPDQRMCVLFYYYDEMSVKEIAQAMETSEGTVKSRLNYARKSIKASVEELEKHGTKLYGVAPLPLLLLFLRMEASQSVMNAAQSAGLASSVLSAVQAETLGAGAVGTGAATGSGAAAGSSAAAGTAAKAGMALGTKIALGVLGVAAAAGIVLAASQMLTPDEPLPAEDEPPVQAEDQLPPEEDPLPEAPEEEPEETTAPEGIPAEALAALDGIAYYGDLSQCTLTSEQALALASVIRQEMEGFPARVKWETFGSGSSVYMGAALFDVGDGTPALFFGGGAIPSWAAPEDRAVTWSNVGTFGIWQCAEDGQILPYAPDGQEPGGYWGQQLVLLDGSLFIGGQQGSDGWSYDGGVYPLTGGPIPTTPQTSASYEFSDTPAPGSYTYQVDGAEATEAEFQEWQNLWTRQEVLCGQIWDGGIGGKLIGLGDAEAAVEALERYAASLGISNSLDLHPDDSALYALVYAQKVRQLLVSGPADCRFDLIDIDGNDVPELVVSYPDPYEFFPRVNLYTSDGGQELYTLDEELTAGLRGSGMYYYPGQNAVRLDTAYTVDMQWTDGTVFYRIDGEHQLEHLDEAPAVSGEALPLEGSRTGEEILAILES